MKMTIKNWYLIYSVMEKEQKAAWKKLEEYRETYGTEKGFRYQFDTPEHEQRHEKLLKNYREIAECVEKLESQEF